jgi:hypothetical protein
MHGIIFGELKKFVETNHGSETWPKLLTAAGLGPRFYASVKEYPDSEALAIVGAASAALGVPAPAILEAFGEFIVPDLLALYGSLIQKDWRTIDVLENTEQTIHRVVRMRNPGATPPELRARRVSPKEVEIVYTSARKMCPVAVGISKGVAKHFGETIRVSQPECMHQGAARCRIVVTAN